MHAWLFGQITSFSVGYFLQPGKGKGIILHEEVEEEDKDKQYITLPENVIHVLYSHPTYVQTGNAVPAVMVSRFSRVCVRVYVCTLSVSAATRLAYDIYIQGSPPGSG